MIAADVDIVARGHVLIVREERRARCVVCRIRRVLYRVAFNAFGSEPAVTEARCAECWGIRAEEA